MDPNAVLPKRHELLFSQLQIPAGSFAFEAFSCISKFTGALLCLFSHHGNLQKEVVLCNDNNYHQCSNNRSFDSSSKNLHKSYGGSKDVINTVLFRNISKFTIVHHFVNEAERLHSSCSVLSLAAALIPSFNVMSAYGLALPLGSDDGVQPPENTQNRICQVGHEEFSGLSFQKLDWTNETIEPRTGIEFPMLLKKNASRSNSEVLVATGSRTMKIIRIKSLKVYAFGFYVHPSSVCQKLGSKYASVPASKLDKCDELYKDLLREDIVMSVRLVVNYNGLKINTVRDVFEKSLRARLVKANPKTDFNCLNDVGSFFTQDIPIPAGTIIDFRRTADGQLITEIGGNLIGAVRSKDLCRAFFGMYIGDVPVSEQTKEEIGRKVVGIIKRC
ncbi:PREDICTED: fatty-acid-binding protein 2-like [Camelina sativa]|uniref:Fatty-acid-binding protein 2-like n=1 Tax=Camelina sativa TaxID=90675 RepID=A0ABM0TQA5_CAMSA|nr:PREDICTED: fatty-acid-binding protein 2-like [Camelina sativa]XP_010429653.1 PREDICTED: fatty-acid-binding protein 2-like [Camelina sativa]